MLSGILHPTSGRATVLGYVPWERKKALKMQFAIVMGQKNQLWWDLPANESLYLNKCNYEIDDKVYQHTLSELTELLDVKHLLNVQVRRLSLGGRMKMELIAALIHKPKLIYLDEPTIGLDILSQKKIREFLRYYNQDKKATVVLTSHYMQDIEDLCRRTIIINQGRIVFDGDLLHVNEVFAQSKIIKLQLSAPVDIYTPWIRQVGVFLLPIFVITNFPPMFVMGRLPPMYLAWSLLIPIILLGLVRMLWQKGLRSYSSASS